MSLNLTRIDYADLNSRQRENYNFQKLSAVLADFGFATLRLSDDWSYADFLAQHIDSGTILRIQLKGRLLFDKKYVEKELIIAFPHGDDWYLCAHDEVLEIVLKQTDTMTGTKSWDERGQYSFPSLGTKLTELLAPYRITGSTTGLDT